MVHIREIEVRHTAALEDYRQFDGPRCGVDDLLRLGREVSAALGARKVWMLNSTASGGGVAEMMPRLCSLLTAVGVDTRWLVLEPGDPKFFEATKALHNMLHGVRVGLPIDQLTSVYAETSREAAAALRPLLTHDDILVVHDPQPVGLVSFLPREVLPRLIWRCHIGSSQRTTPLVEGWRLLAPFLEPFERLLFSLESYIPDELFSRAGVLAPSIDPLSHKNRELHSYKLIGVLRSAALAPGPPQPPWARFAAVAQRYVDGRWQTRPIEELLYVPLVTQISRFDRLKGFEYVIPAFAQMLRDAEDRVAHMKVDTARAVSEVQRVQLVLAGPDPGGIADDPEARGVLEQLCALHQELPLELRERVHLVKLPMADVRQNALAVNALQRQSSVIVQNSVQEGFGLTVTEALWKGTPVVASNVGGIAHQVRNAVDGLLIHDPSDTCALGEALLRLLAYSKQAEKMANCARLQVREHFLITTHVRRWLEEFQALLALQHPAQRLMRPDGASMKERAVSTLH